MGLSEIINDKLRIRFSIKLFIIFTLLTALLTTLLTILYISSEIRDKRAAYGEKAQILATNLAENARLPLYAENREMLMLLTMDAMRQPEIDSVVFSTVDGRVLADFHRHKNASGSELISKTVEVRSDPLGESADTFISGGSSNTRALIGNVRLDLAPAGLAKLPRNTALKAFSIAFGFWVMVAAIAYAGLRKATHSFDKLMQGIETMRAGNFAARIDVEDEDEPGRAAQAVNELAATLQERDRENAQLHEELVNALRLEVQEEKKQLMAKLIQTNRMTSLGLLASSMAHEINNPNGSIRLANQYLTRAFHDSLPLLQRISDEEGDFNLGGIPFSSATTEIAESFATINRSTERISHVIKDLRSYSLGEHNEFADAVDINKVVTGALTIVRSHGMYSGMTLLSDAEDNLPLVTGSQHQLEQVLINLLMNAIQATHHNKGKVVVHSCFDRANSQVCVSVSDEGEGISPENLNQLVEPFFSTRIDNGGSGLGLFVSNYIITAHKGKLDFASTPGAGTTVTVRIPVNSATKKLTPPNPLLI